MTPFFIYSITSLATAIQIYSILMMAIWGRPPQWNEEIGLLGSLILLVAAFGTLFSLKYFRWLALIASFLLGCFYFPAIYGTFFVYGINVHDLSQKFYNLFPLLCFLLASLYTALSLIYYTKSNFWFPVSTSSRARRIIFLSMTTSIALLILTYILFIDVKKEIETPVTWNHEIIEGCPALRFTFKDPKIFRSFNGFETNSPEVLKYVNQLSTNQTSVQIKLTYDFGKIQALGGRAILGDISFSLNDIEPCHSSK